MKQRLIECQIIHAKTDNLFFATYIVRKSYPQKDDFFIDKNNIIKHCINKGYNMFGGDVFEDTEGYPYIDLVLVIIGTNDVGLNNLGVPKIPKLYEKLDNIKVKFEEYEYHSVLDGGVDMGSIGCKLRPTLTGTGTIITSF